MTAAGTIAQKNLSIDREDGDCRFPRLGLCALAVLLLDALGWIGLN